MNGNPHDDLYLDSLESLWGDAVAQILEHEDPDRFLDWLREHLHEYYSNTALNQLADPQDYARIATGLGRAIWNAMPLPGNNFRPRPLPEPGRNDPCPCGSGNKYKRCCARGPALPRFDSQLLWPLILERLPRASFHDLISRGRVPVEALMVLADQYCERHQPKKAASFLEPLFDGPVRKPDEAHDYALNMLCNFYDELGHHKKKTTLLERIIDTTRRSPLRSGAWQRTAAIRMDKGDIPGAWKAFRQAQRDDPESLSIGVLEVQLLMAENRTTKAQARANFWVKRLRRAGLSNDEGPLEFLSAVAHDPITAMMDLGLVMAGGAGEGLDDWLQGMAGRHVPEYRATTGEPGPDEEGEPGDPLDSLFLVPPPAIMELEVRWREVFPAAKPFSVYDESSGGEDAWGEEVEEVWMAFLDDHPEAFDSLDIIDDLATALIEHHQYGTPWLDETLLKPLLLRTAGIIDQALNDIPSPRIVWAYAENRPALRSLARLVSLYLRSGDNPDAMEWAERLLALNPNDNHGFRSMIVNQWLVDGNDAGVLEIVGNYPHDAQPEIPYGRVLALYRLQRLQEAQDALCEAMENLPKVVRYLSAKRVRRPKLDPMGVRYGGDDQAWLYRDAMRDVWVDTPGAIDWLKQAAMPGK